MIPLLIQAICFLAAGGTATIFGITRHDQLLVIIGLLIATTGLILLVRWTNLYVDEIDAETEDLYDCYGWLAWRYGELTPAEALYGFAAWLTGREDELTIGAGHECGVVAGLVHEFCKANDLAEPDGDWSHKLRMPKSNEEEE